MNYHIIYTEHGQVLECEIPAEGPHATNRGYEDIEALFRVMHPEATHWEIGIPVVWVV